MLAVAFEEFYFKITNVKFDINAIRHNWQGQEMLMKNTQFCESLKMKINFILVWCPLSVCSLEETWRRKSGLFQGILYKAETEKADHSFQSFTGAPMPADEMSCPT